MTLRIGQGIDIHAFAPERKLVLGGVTIPFEKGLLGHSDADVILHAVCDAILGALALGDIGTHFSDQDPRYRGIDSRILLREVVNLMKTTGYAVNNIDVTVLAQAPKLAVYIPQMRENIANDLECKFSQVSIKATTTEKLGFIGQEEGIAASAVVILMKVNESNSLENINQ